MTDEDGHDVSPDGESTTMEDTLEQTNDDEGEEDSTVETDEVEPASAFTVDPTLLMERQNAIKVIKGEIHNVLNVMRSDARYASPLRFSEEVGLEEHPLLIMLKELDETLTHADLKDELKLLQYLQPFCSAISGRDISASVTGASLNALHKFLLYGFIVEGTPEAMEGMALVAKSLLHCTFEESTHGPDGKRKANLSARQSQVWHDDEQVVLKLLNLAALVVRVSLQRSSSILDATLVVGLLDTCLHVSHRAMHASGLLKSAATDASCQIVLVVFQVDPDVGDVSQARATILSSLANLVNPSQSTDRTCVTSLTLVNIALETMKDQPSQAEIAILHNDLCKHLLQWSTTHDLVILSLTLRVIFNLFQTIRNHMKLPLEIFLTSVHLRILDPTIKNFRDEQREVALESLLEFCQEPAMMQDLYLNYDCDVHCTNLFESICGTLSRMATPEGAFVNSLNRLALEGLLAVMDSVGRKCTPGERFLKTSTDVLDETDEETSLYGGTMPEDDASYDNLGARWQAEENHKVIQERKRRKHALQLIAHEFNRNNPSWMVTAQELDLFSADPTPSAVASFLYTTPQLDMTQLGLYLSKGPDEKYPFHQKVRAAFVALFDFKELGFSGSLRTFLAKFRLPGEAQCIDRLMESFSTELYQQQQEKPTSQPLEIEDEGVTVPNANFKSSDAVFRMAFSTIMLNTDLHNPGMKEDKRMTLDEFIRNNRGLNDEDDFPVDFLTFIYHDFQENELQVQKEFLDVIRRHHEDAEIPAKHWEDILKRLHIPANFTPAGAAYSHISKAGINDRDMFVSIAKAAIQSISNIFVRSTNDALVTKALGGFQEMSKICVYFDLDETFNDILQILLGHGRDYIMSCIALEYAGLDSAEIMAAGPSPNTHNGSASSDIPSQVVMTNEAGAPLSVPQEFLVKSISFSDVTEVMTGAAAHRGLLSLDCGFTLIRKQPDRIREAWPTLIECLCALRDARALPDRVIFLDDFADSRGNLLPLSPFAKQSQRRLDEYYRSLGSDRDKKKGWMTSFFTGKKEQQGLASLFHGDTEDFPDQNEKELSSFSVSLLQVTKRAKLEQVVLMRPKNLPMAKQTVRALLDAIDAYPYFDDPIFEQHAVYSLELALLALISNRDRSADLYPTFLAKFETVLHGGTSEHPSESQPKNIPTPFLMERVVVTILRACIHLYDIPEARPQLKKSLHLFMALPPNFIRFVSDRIACGMAIFLSQKFHLLENAADWEFIISMLDMLAFFGPGRGFVFDGVANTVESQMMAMLEDGEERHILTKEGSLMLTKPLLKFVFGTYQNDISLSIPAMMCLENLYRHIILLDVKIDTSNGSNENKLHVVHDQVLWQNIAVAFYAVCRNFDPNTSLQGTDCFQRFIAATPMGSLPDEKWIVLLHLIVNKQPPVTSEAPRLNCCILLCKILLMSIAHLSKNKEYWEDLTDIVNQMAVLVGENLRAGRRGKVSPLFESTLQSVTFLCNHLVSENFTGNPEYGNWVSDTLLSELEKVGAGGGSSKNLAATKSLSELTDLHLDYVAMDDGINKP